jgi:hypothetical protein
MKAPKLHVDTKSSPKRRIGIRAFAVAVFAALFGLAPAAHASDRGRGAERGKEEAERGKERGREEAERGKRREERERSKGHGADAGGEKD